MLIYRRSLEVANAAAKDDPKGNVALQTVSFDDQGRVAATDGHLWLRVAALVNEPDLFTSERLAELSPLRAESAVLPSAVVKDFNAACKRGGHDHLVVSSGEDGQTTLATVDGKTTRTFLVKPGEQPFPAVDKTIPAKPVALRVLLSTDLLKKLIGTLRGLGASSVEFHFYSPIEPIRIGARGLIGKELCAIDGAVMPMRDDASPEPEPSRPPKDDTQVELTDVSTGEVLFKGSAEQFQAAAHRAASADATGTMADDPAADEWDDGDEQNPNTVAAAAETTEDAKDEEQPEPARQPRRRHADSKSAAKAKQAGGKKR